MSGMVEFPAAGRKNKRTSVRNHCVCERVRSTRSVYKQPPGLKTPNQLPYLAKDVPEKKNYSILLILFRLFLVGELFAGIFIH